MKLRPSQIMIGFALTLAATSQAQTPVGSQIVNVTGADRIKATASLTEVTRISSEGEPFLSVVDAVSNKNVSVDYQILGDTGDIYVTVDGAKSGTTISAFGITATNTYNFNLKLLDVPAQQILIRNTNYLAEQATQQAIALDKKTKKETAASATLSSKTFVKLNRSSSYKVELIGIMRGLYMESGIPGFKRTKDRTSYGLRDNVVIKGHLKYVSNRFEAYVLNVRTTSRLIATADESIIADFNPIAWTITDDLIESTKDTRILLIKERDSE
ncbi:MAG: hypothetical protein COA43_00650 [Robiginitomaculum sp.]|nr:MAG: hypothetical protein COA43_00650 [Robiginitomaculum sp.]